ncbi:MAG TPA: ATP-binding protein [Polyangiaceae bacterium]|nr:ATP-binding protein [Polyangiaceae bacterium]
MPVNRRDFSLGRFTRKFIPGSLESPGVRRRAEVGVALSLIWIPLTLIRATVFFAHGLVVQGTVGLLVCAAGTSLPVLLRRTGSLALFGNAVAFLWFVALSSLTYQRGGIGSPALVALGFVPIGATFVAGARAGVTWATLVILEIATYGVLHHAGVRLVDHYPAGGRVFIEGIGATLLTLAALSISLAYEATASSALSDAERAERASSALLAAMPDLGIVIDRNGVCREWRGRTSTLPVLPETILGRSLDVLSPELGRTARERAAALLDGGEASSVELVLTIAGEFREYEIRFVPSGEDTVLLVLRDLGELRRLNRRATAAEEEAKMLRSDRMAQVGQLAAAVAHEANNPLSYVIANLSFVKDRLGKTRADALESARATLDEAISEALSGADRVRRIVKDLKTFAREDDPEPHLVDLELVVSAALKLTSAVVRHRARLETHFERAPKVLGSENSLVQVFVNLITNAAQAIPVGRADSNEIRVTIGTSPEDGSAVVRVSDTGEGIPPEDLRRVAQPFFTTKPIGVGTGLGLTVTENIVTGGGGKLDIQSTVGKGTTVTIALPAAPPDMARVLSSKPAPPAAKRSLRVLAIDDDPLVLKAIRRVLSAHELTSTTQGREAISLLADDGKEFDVVLCDLMMPDLTGIDVFERAAALGRGLEKRFVFLTGGAFTPETVDFLQSSANLRLEKPFSPRGLENALLRVATENAPRDADRSIE